MKSKERERRALDLILKFVRLRGLGIMVPTRVYSTNGFLLLLIVNTLITVPFIGATTAGAHIDESSRPPPCDR